jgi:hypothetical protein
MNRKLLVALALALLLGGILAGNVLAKNIRADNQAKAEATQTETAYRAFLHLGLICSGDEKSFPENAPYSAGPGPHPVVTLTGSGSYYRDDNVGTGDWDPATAQAAELILCMTYHSDVVEQCRYKSETSSKIGTLERTQYTQELRLFSARTGELLATETMLGDEPDECPDDYTFYGSSMSSTLYGSYLPDSEIEAWLRPYVMP